MTWLFIPVFVLIVLLGFAIYLLHEAIQKIDTGSGLKTVPRFTKGEKICAKHNGPAGEFPAEVQMFVPLGEVELPVTVYICQECQDLA